MSDQLQQLYDRGITGLNLEPGDSLCGWAHGEILRLRAAHAKLLAQDAETLDACKYWIKEFNAAEDQLVVLRAEVADCKAVVAVTNDDRGQLRAEVDKLKGDALTWAASSDAYAQKVYDLEAEFCTLQNSVSCAVNALTDSILVSGNDAATNMHFVRKLSAALASSRRDLP